MNKFLIFCSIEKLTDCYRVRYIKHNSYKHTDFDTLLEAVAYAQNTLQASKDEILLNLNK